MVKLSFRGGTAFPGHFMTKISDGTFLRALRAVDRGYTAVFPAHYPPAASWSRAPGAPFIRSAWGAALKRRPELGLYVHIPFCASVCEYCNITVRQVAPPAAREAYLRRLFSEAELYAPLFSGRSFRNVFIGGGTPNLLSPEQLADLFAALRRNFRLSPGVRVVMDASPMFLDDKRLAVMVRGGLTGISIGGQSFDDGVIKRSGRTQNNSSIHAAYLRARKHGIKHINVDVMMGLPGQTVESSLRDVATVAAWRPEEIFIGEFSPVNTPFARRGGSVSESHRRAAHAAWKESFRILKAAGYHHRGTECFASLDPKARTWAGFFPFLRNSSLLGLGLGAVSWAWGSARYQNTDSLGEYSRMVGAGRFPVAAGGAVTRRQEMIHFILTGLEAGILSRAEFRGLFGHPPERYFGAELRGLSAAGVLRLERGLYKVAEAADSAFEYSKAFYEPEVVRAVLRKAGRRRR